MISLVMLLTWTTVIIGYLVLLGHLVLLSNLVLRYHLYHSIWSTYNNYQCSLEKNMNTDCACTDI